MIAAPRFGWQGGEVRAIEQCGVSLLDRGLLFGESVYEVLPIAGAKVRLLAEHLERMSGGAAVLGIEAAVPSVDQAATLAAQLIAAEALEEGILYVQVTGGAAARSHAPAVPPTPGMFAFAQAMALPRGVDLSRPRRVVSAADPRWARCDLKTTMLLPALLSRRAHPEADEVVFFSADGTLTEGGSTCVLIVEARAIVLPPLSPRVLSSVTRRVLAELAAQADLEVRCEPIDRARLLAADEVGLASTTKLVLGVGHVDDCAVAHVKDGVCALLARMLRRRYGLAEA